MQPVHFLVDGEGRTLSSPFIALRKATDRDVAEHALIAHAVEATRFACFLSCGRNQSSYSGRFHLSVGGPC